MAGLGMQRVPGSQGLPRLLRSCSSFVAAAQRRIHRHAGPPGACPIVSPAIMRAHRSLGACNVGHRKESPVALFSTGYGGFHGNNINEDGKPPPSGMFLVDKLNHAFFTHPVESMLSFVLLDASVIGISYTIFSLTGVAFSGELLLAWGISRVLKRLRFPLEVLIAHGITNIAPAIAKVQVSLMMTGAFKGLEQPAPSPNQPEIVNKMQKAANSATEYGQKILDRYGLAMTLSMRLCGVSIVAILYAALSQGLDVAGWLAEYGYEGIGTTGGTFAAAVLVNSCVYPGSVIAVGYLAPLLAVKRKQWALQSLRHFSR